MIDIHSHLIHRVDDGSPDLETSLKMLSKMSEEGTDSVFCTPHYRKPYIRSAESIRRKFSELKAAAEERGIPVKLYLGQEIYCKIEEYKELLKSGKVLTMNDGKFVLLEFDFNNHIDIAEVVYEVKAMGLIPIVAHIERYSYATIEEAYEIKKIGGFIQVNSDSVIGNGGHGVKKIVKQLFKEGFVDFVASDVHFGRENTLCKAYEYVKKKFGIDAAEVTFNENAKRILKGQTLV